MLITDRTLLMAGAVGLTGVTVSGIAAMTYLGSLGLPIPPALAAVEGAAVSSLLAITLVLVYRTKSNGGRPLDRGEPPR